MSDAAAAARGFAGTACHIGARLGPDETGFQIAFRRCESPIEQAFCLALFQVAGVNAVDGIFDHTRIPEIAGDKCCITIFAQQPILHYRADFLLLGTSPLSAEPVFVIVECDGQEFHSEREQRRRDTQRQTALVNTGFKVIRFPGSTLFGDPQAVVSTTLDQFVAHGWRSQMVNVNLLRNALRELRQALDQHLHTGNLHQGQNNA